VKTFRWNNRFWLLQLRRNINGRFIMLSNFTNSGQSRSIIFPEGPFADGWFVVAKMLKEVLIKANKSSSRKKPSTPRTSSGKMTGQPSFAEVVPVGSRSSKSTKLKGWRCRNCGSWDVFAAVIGGFTWGYSSRASA